MKVLIYTHRFPPSLGGIQTMSYLLARGLQDSGKDITVLAPGTSAGPEAEDSSYRFTIVRIPFAGKKELMKWLPPLKYLLGMIFYLTTIVRLKPDAVILVDREAQITGSLLSFLSPGYIVRVPAITKFRYTLREFWEIPQIFLIRKLYERASWIVCISKIAKEVLENAGIPTKNATVIYNGVDSMFLETPRDEKRTEDLRSSLGLKDSDRIILTVARLVPRKGHSAVIRAMPEILAKFPDAKYLVAGSGSHRPVLERLVRELGLESSVIFAGEVPYESTLEYYDISEIFIMPHTENVDESFGNVLIEAASRQLPLIARNFSGPREIIEHGKTGWLIDTTDEIAGYVSDLLGDRNKAREFGKAARDRVEAQFTEKRMIDGFVKVLDDSFQGPV